jgi:hypothetical protein
MQIKSSSFNNGGKIPSRYTCDAIDVNPPLEITNIPQSAKSLALILDDPDAPSKTWVHWLLWNIPVKNSSFSIEENTPPKDAIYGKNDFDKLEYTGPCPPSGTHRYFFKVYALDRELELKEGSTKTELMNKVNEHLIESAELAGLYTKKI